MTPRALAVALSLCLLALTGCADDTCPEPFDPTEACSSAQEGLVCGREGSSSCGIDYTCVKGKWVYGVSEFCN